MKPIELIDTHSHFNLPQFEKDRDVAILRMEEAGVGTLCIGVDQKTSRLSVALAQAHKSIWAVVGQHPTDTEAPFDKEVFRLLAREARVVAIGECGLDYYRLTEADAGEEKQRQEIIFREHIELALEAGLPLMLHIRPSPNAANDSGGARQGIEDAYYDALTILKEYKTKAPTLSGTAHFFVGGVETATAFLDLGFHLSFSGVITNFSEYEAVVREVPLERILPETDAPYAAPSPWRGTRAEPWHVRAVVEKIAEIKNLPFEHVAATLLTNANQLFNLAVG